MSQAFLFDKFAQPTTAGTDIVEPPIVYHECSMKILDDDECKQMVLNRRLSVKMLVVGKKDRVKKVFNVLDVETYPDIENEVFPLEIQFDTDEKAQEYIQMETEFANFCKSKDLVWDGRRYLLKEVDGELVRWHDDDDNPSIERGLVLG